MSAPGLVIASRASPLALAQADLVAGMLTAQGRACEILPLTTAGDLAGGTPGKDAFVGEVRQAVLDGRCQLAVHSLKDVPVEPMDGLELIAITRRADPTDVLIAPGIESLDALPDGAAVGSASLRRRCLLTRMRSDLKMLEIRGNIQTRLRKLDEGRCQALILARAGLERLQMTDHISCELPLPDWPPAPGQGALAVECRSDHAERDLFASALNHPASQLCTSAERSFSQALGGDCRAPLAAWARLDGERMHLDGLVGSPDGQRSLREETEGQVRDLRDSEELGRQLADVMQRQGARALLAGES